MVSLAGVALTAPMFDVLYDVHRRSLILGTDTSA